MIKCWCSFHFIRVEFCRLSRLRREDYKTVITRIKLFFLFETFEKTRRLKMFAQRWWRARNAFAQANPANASHAFHAMRCMAEIRGASSPRKRPLTVTSNLQLVEQTKHSTESSGSLCYNRHTPSIVCCVTSKICLANHYTSVMIAHSSRRLVAAVIRGCNEVEKPQLGGAGCGYPSTRLAEAPH